MKRTLDFLWPVLGLIAVVASLWILSKEFRGAAVASEVWHQLLSISAGHYLLCILSALIAYAALACYDLIALRHLGMKHISFVFIALCSFTTYALSHTIGVPVFSGAMVRYRAYSTKGLTAADVAVLVAICSITFALGLLLLGGYVLVFEPQELRRVASMLPHVVTNIVIARVIGVGCLAAILLYVAASVSGFRSFKVGPVRMEYPSPGIAALQLCAAPLELLGAAGILFFALPAEGNPGFMVVLAVFLGSFAAALASNAPGGVGVFELLFINALPTIPNTKVLAAVLMFRLFYLLIPLLFSIVVVVIFERQRLSQMLHHEALESSRTAGRVAGLGRRLSDPPGGQAR